MREPLQKQRWSTTKATAAEQEWLQFDRCQGPAPKEALHRWNNGPLTNLGCLCGRKAEKNGTDATWREKTNVKKCIAAKNLEIWLQVAIIIHMLECKWLRREDNHLHDHTLAAVGCRAGMDARMSYQNREKRAQRVENLQQPLDICSLCVPGCRPTKCWKLIWSSCRCNRPTSARWMTFGWAFFGGGSGKMKWSLTSFIHSSVTMKQCSTSLHSPELFHKQQSLEWHWTRHHLADMRPVASSGGPMEPPDTAAGYLTHKCPHPICKWRTPPHASYVSIQCQKSVMKKRFSQCRSNPLAFWWPPQHFQCCINNKVFFPQCVLVDFLPFAEKWIQQPCFSVLFVHFAPVSKA